MFLSRNIKLKTSYHTSNRTMCKQSFHLYYTSSWFHNWYVTLSRPVNCFIISYFSSETMFFSFLKIGHATFNKQSRELGRRRISLCSIHTCCHGNSCSACARTPRFMSAVNWREKLIFQMATVSPSSNAVSTAFLLYFYF